MIPGPFRLDSECRNDPWMDRFDQDKVDYQLATTNTLDYCKKKEACIVPNGQDKGHFPALPNLSRDEGKKWIVNLMRDTRMGANAKIDLEKNVTKINRPPLHVYQSVIKKTRRLALRMQAMGAPMTLDGSPSIQPLKIENQLAAVEGAQ